MGRPIFALTIVSTVHRVFGKMDLCFAFAAVSSFPQRFLRIRHIMHRRRSPGSGGSGGRGGGGGGGGQGGDCRPLDLPIFETLV